MSQTETPPRPATAPPTLAGPLVVLPPTPPRRRRWPAWLLALALLAAAAGAAWWEFGKPPVLATVTPWQGPAIEAVYATGVVEAVDAARIGTTIATRIVALMADEGDRVAAGQLLAQLDDRQAQQRLADARTRLDLAEQELARDRALVGQAIRTQQQLQRSQQARDAAEAAVQLAARQLDEYRILSPLAGIVMRRPVEPGETVAANATLFEIASPAALKIAADVDERDIARVTMGARVAIRADAFPGRATAATITNIRGRGESATRTFRVEATLPPDTGLLIGMTVDVNIVVAERPNAQLVPPSAIRHDPPQGGQPGQAYVFRLENGHARRTNVTAGAAGPTAIELTTPLPPQTTLIANPPASLADGAAVAAGAP